MTGRSNIAKIVPIRNPDGPHLENLFFISPETTGQLTGNWVGSIQVTGRSNELNLFRSEIQDGHHVGRLGNLFFPSPPELNAS